MLHIQHIYMNRHLKFYINKNKKHLNAIILIINNKLVFINIKYVVTLSPYIFGDYTT